MIECLAVHLSGNVHNSIVCFNTLLYHFPACLFVVRDLAENQRAVIVGNLFCYRVFGNALRIISVQSVLIFFKVPFSDSFFGEEVRGQGDRLANVKERTKQQAWFSKQQNQGADRRLY